MPASEVRGEGIFLRVDEDLLANWEQAVEGSFAVEAHREAYKRFRHNRYSGRLPGDFDPEYGWPRPRYIALHTLSHLLIRAIALECGYSSASLSERIYSRSSGPDGDPRAGILIYTAVPDAEGTLGGLVSQAEPEPSWGIFSNNAFQDPVHLIELYSGHYEDGGTRPVGLVAAGPRRAVGRRRIEDRFVGK